MAIGQLTSNISNVNLSILIFALQWIILAIIGIITYIRFVKNKKEEQRKLNIRPIKKERKIYSQTDLDTLYKLLKEKNSLSTQTIGKFFQIPKDKALEWAKILENNKLVTIEYPAFNDPEIIIKTKSTTKGEKEKLAVDFFSIKQEGEKEEKDKKKKNKKPEVNKIEIKEKTIKKEKKIPAQKSKNQKIQKKKVSKRNTRKSKK